jgi:hypothetical protein
MYILFRLLPTKLERVLESFLNIIKLMLLLIICITQLLYGLFVCICEKVVVISWYNFNFSSKKCRLLVGRLNL